MRRFWAGLLACALVPVATVVGSAGVASAAPVVVPLDCVASTPIGPQDADQDLDIDVTAPSQVLPGATFSVVAATPVSTFPSNVQGNTINSGRDFVLRLPVPANATYVGSSLAGGVGLGAGTPTIGLEGGNVVLRVPGPISGGATYQFPTVTMQLQATGADLTTIQPRIGGVVGGTPGFELTVNATLPLFGASDLATDCWPKPGNPALSTTTIVAPDTTPPVVTIASPIDGGTYPLGSAIAVDYSCDDGPFGSGVAACNGDLADGAPLDTSALGTFTFAVTADDALGNGPTTVTHSYTVVPPIGDTVPPVITITAPAHGATYALGATVAASFSCSDADSGLASCVGSVASGAAINTSTVGVKTVTVDAVDLAGVPARVVHTYRVMPAVVQQNFDAVLPLGSAPNRVPLNCNTLFGAFDESIPFDAASGGYNGAPTQVGENGTLSWEFRIGRDVIPPFNNGSNLLYRFAAPQNGTFTAVQFTGAGTGVNSPTITIVGGKIELRIPSVVDAGLFVNDPFQPPPVRATIQATGAVGSVVRTQLEHFQLSTTLGGTSSCPAGDPDDGDGAEANPFLTATTVVDTTPPSITITRPGPGAVYAPGSTVAVDYSCADSAGVSSCIGDLANGAALDTTTSGSYLFGVVAIDANGNPTQQSSTYTVAPPTVDLVGPGTVAEDGGSIAFDVVLTNPSTKTVTVDYATSDGTATAGDDYTATSDTLTFTPGGALSASISVPVLDDSVFEGNETFDLTLTSATNATLGESASVVTVLEDDDPDLVVTGGNALENAPTVTFTVALSADPTNPVPVTYATADGSAITPFDYDALSGGFTFLPGGPLSIDVVVALNNDAVYEGDQTFDLVATNTNTGQVRSGTATIVEDEVVPPTVSIGSVELREGDDPAKPTLAQLTVTLSRPAATEVSVNFSTVGLSATPNTDYVPRVGKILRFRNGAVVKKVAIPVKADLLAEGDETFEVLLSSASGLLIGDGVGEVVIRDDDAPTSATPELAVSDQWAYEGNTFEGRAKVSRLFFTVSLSRPAATDLSIQYLTAIDDATAGVDYVAKPLRTITFRAGQVRKVVTITIKSDDLAELDETLRVIVTSAPGVSIADGTGVGTILDDD
ncbi:MAG TPA: Calx-beta domain-containing protein [Acidimicrobiia bacterium]|nr:Calx-beta domain-containing protein [Acidimicrobiia bacterium]